VDLEAASLNKVDLEAASLCIKRSHASPTSFIRFILQSEMAVTEIHCSTQLPTSLPHLSSPTTQNIHTVH
jgi:hypothetical protein